ncbi:hypothetical protein B0A49_10684 [Cryomyces minteri]|uniref:Uncharacterized protein n=1 Tax=Cryomyces minteri TaxID=331657 RepID=A0A4U0WUM6_9PEZI|nr:hypothetical protein B0A49_10684 [Cryomyces minteri]
MSHHRRPSHLLENFRDQEQRNERAPSATSDSPRSPSVPLAGPGATRNRRLQLRNTGFRGAALPPRNITPKSIWSSQGSEWDSADTESSPVGLRTMSVETIASRHNSSQLGILQEVSNSSLRRSNHSRPGLDNIAPISATSELFNENVGGFRNEDGGEKATRRHQVSHSNKYKSLRMDSPKPIASPQAVKVPKVRNRGSTSQKRRSMSAEATKYIEHLESELAAVQTQLVSLTSPTTTRAQSTKLRNINAETKVLRDEVAAWENSFQDRVQEEVQQHEEVETGLRARIRTLENEVEVSAYRLRELECEAEERMQSLDALEEANRNLERRLEFMSELVASSPKKVDLCSEVPTRKERVRPKSMLPRIPTTDGLRQISPTRSAVCHSELPDRPMTSDALNASQEPNWSFDHGFERNHARSRSSIDVLSELSEPLLEGSSLNSTSRPTSSIFDMPAQFPTPVAPLHSDLGMRSRPARRMRRFHAGSTGMKPLILPSTTHAGTVPASAPILGADRTPEAYPFPSIDSHTEALYSQSPIERRRRSATWAEVGCSSDSNAFDYRDLSTSLETGDETVVIAESEKVYVTPRVPSMETSGNRRSPPSNTSAFSHGDRSSLGSKVGRNLFEELSRVKREPNLGSPPSAAMVDSSNETGPDPDGDGVPSAPLSTKSDIHRSPTEQGRASSMQWQPPRRCTTSISIADDASAPQTPRSTSSHSPKQRTRRTRPPPRITRVVKLFADLWQHPTLTARSVVSNAWSLSSAFTKPALEFRWWLIGFLLGPMARRRLTAIRTLSLEADGLDFSNVLFTRPRRDKRQCINEQGEQECGDAECAASPAALPVTALEHPFSSPTKNTNSQHPSLYRRRSTKRSKRDHAAPTPPKQHAPQPTLPQTSTHSPWLWLKFSLTLVLALGAAIKDGPGTLFAAA